MLYLLIAVLDAPDETYREEPLAVFTDPTVAEVQRDCLNDECERRGITKFTFIVLERVQDGMPIIDWAGLASI